MYTEIEDLKIKTSNLEIKNIYRTVDPEICEKYISEFISLLDHDINKHEFTRIKKNLCKKYSINPSVTTMNYTYYKLFQEGKLERNQYFEMFNVTKMCRTNSGITQITVMSSPYPNGKEFSCEHNCYYCPNEPAHEGNNWTPQPRSYLYNEDAVKRGNDNNFEPTLQMWNRMSALLLCGLNIDKLEVMVLGGTWGSYPIDYRDDFIRDLYYAANTFYIDNNKRPEKKSLYEEQKINETALARIIGLTLETRPDHLYDTEINLLNKYNCTRVQVGVQSLDDKVMKKLNRGCYYEDVVRGIKNLLNCGFKVDIHIMFDLPFVSSDEDKEMFDRLLKDTNVRFDQAKLYPFASLDWTVTKQWEDSGKELHYTQEELIDVLIHAKTRIPPWVRLNRVIRDFPHYYILDGNNKPNLRQDILSIMKDQGLECKCIRCREVKNKKEAIEIMDKMQMFIRSYEASGGTEYFISFESPDNKYIYGFIRLRLSKELGYITHILPKIKRKRQDKEEYINIFPFLNGCAMIRELHVYGNMTQVDHSTTHTQHRGLGKKLLQKAESIAVKHGYKKIAVISGVGVRKYYEKFGYKYNNNYMIKDLKWKMFRPIILAIIIIIISYFISFLV